jgi:YegS/Rv2252/BmrU family lipid kinase
MPGPRRLLVIVNTQGARAGQDLRDAIAVLRVAGCAVRLEEPESPSEIPDLIGRLAGTCDAVVIGGGDGTLSRAVSAVIDAKRPLGILPLGTANDLARALGIPFAPREAAVVIARGALRRIDVGRVNGTLFLNGAALGMSTRVTRKLAGETKRRWGVLSYALASARSIRDRRAFRATVTCDGVRHELHSIQIHVANGRHYGGGMTASEDADVDDGRLVLLSVRARSLLSLVRLLPSLRAGRHRPHEPTDVLRGNVFEIRTRRSQEISTDGELTGCSTPVTIDQLRLALPVYAPERSR